jgi:antibiotic biosynthesis monooxygenase (ABM) superfamily enzyme
MTTAAIADPVTVVATFQVAAGREVEFEHWAHDITAAAAGFPGHLGASWMRSKSRYQVVYRFASQSQFHDWHESSTRAAFLAGLAPIARLVTDDHLTGLETWFELPNEPGRPAPPRWKMVIVTWLGVFPLLGLLQWQVGPHIANVALPIRVMLFAFVVVTLMTYLVMPRLTMILRRWLYAS